MPVLTISGQAGSRAREIGRLTAQRLQIDYVDQEILVEAARQLGVPVESVVSLDERAASRGERLAAMFRRFLERSAAAGAGDPMLGAGGLDIVLGRTYGEAAAAEGPQEVPDEMYISTLNGIVRELAARGDVVIIGRGSQVSLRDWPGATHVLLVAPHSYRVELIAQRDGLSAEDATKRVHEGDKGRSSFHQKFFKVSVDDPALYHLALNSARFSDEEAADLIAEVARRVSATKQPA